MDIGYYESGNRFIVKKLILGGNLVNKKTFVVLLVLIILFTSSAWVKAHAKGDLTTRLKENLIPLKTTQAGNGFEDLMPLKEILKDKKIIGMGEATHGTKEFFEMKHRMFEFLVEEMGYRVFGIEAEFGCSQIVNDYILNGKGSIKECLDSLNLWPWETQEVADMIEWMKEYNKKAADKDKIRFYGFDMQLIRNDINQILEYLEKVDSSNVEKYKSKLSKVGNILSFNNKRKKLEELAATFTDNKDEYISRSSQEEYDLMIQHIIVMKQWISYIKKTPRSLNDSFRESFNIRDKSMTQNVKWILDHEEKYYGNNKMMLWAHNGHIGRYYFGLSVMGSNLSEVYGNEYYSLGFDFYQGGFKAMPVSIFNKVVGGRKPQYFNLKSSPEDSYGYEMEKTGIPISFLDFKSASKDKEISQFISSKINMNTIGAAYTGSWFASDYLAKSPPNKSYDGVIFIKTTNASNQPSYQNNSLKDGDELLKRHYLFLALPKLLIAIFLLIMSYRKSKSRDLSYSIEEFHVLGKDIEDKKDVKGVKSWILRLHEYIAEISTRRYIVLAIIILFIINLILRINGLTSLADNINNLRDLDIMDVILLISNVVIENFKFHFLPLTILAFLSQDKSIKSSHIIVSSLILALFRFRFGDPFSIIIYFLNGIVLNYSYTLYYYKNKRPFTVINTIKIGEYILRLFI